LPSKKEVVHKGRYPEDLRLEAVKKAVELNNNYQAAEFIKAKYSKEGLYQNIHEKTIREWRKDPTLNSQLHFDQANLSRRKTRKLFSPYIIQEEDLIKAIKKRDKKVNK